MKKLTIALCGAMMGVLAHADVDWSWWMEKETATPELSLGLATRCKSVETFELALLYGGSPVKSGAQVALLGLNDADSTCALQLGWVNRGKKPCVQLGFLNFAKAATFDMGFANVSDDAKFQLGFLNFNKKGFLPVFVFVNFDPSIFK